MAPIKDEKSTHVKQSETAVYYSELQRNLTNRIPFLPNQKRKLPATKLTRLAIKYIDHLERILVDLTNKSVDNNEFRTFVRFDDFAKIAKEETEQNLRDATETPIDRKSLETFMDHYDSSRLGPKTPQPLAPSNNPDKQAVLLSTPHVPLVSIQNTFKRQTRASSRPKIRLLARSLSASSDNTQHASSRFQHRHLAHPYHITSSTKKP